jgi:protocatechuate 3,4-dioxygenase beta subunit
MSDIPQKRAQIVRIALIVGIVTLFVAGLWLLRGGPDDKAANDAGNESGPSSTERPRPALLTPEGGVILKGRVVDVSGQPIAGAVLRARFDGDAATDIETDSKSDDTGAFEFSGMAPGRYRIAVSGDRIVSSEVRFVEAPGQIEILVSRDVTLSGVVANVLPGTEVFVASDAAPWPTTVAVTESGTFSSGGFLAGRYRVWARSENAAARAVAITRTGREPSVPLVLVLEPAITVTGQVVDRETRNGVWAIVSLADDLGLEPERRVATDEAGRFTFSAVIPGRYTASAFAPTHVLAESVSFDARDNYHPEISVTAGGVVAGRVVDERGSAVAGATVALVGKKVGGESVLVAEQSLGMMAGEPATGGTPAFSLIPRGELGVMAGPIPPIPVTPKVLIATPTTAPPEDSPVVAVPPAVQSAFARSFVSDADGRFEIGGLWPGTYRAEVKHPDHAPAVSGEVLVRMGKTSALTVVLLPGVQVEGDVSADGRPVSGTRIVARLGKSPLVEARSDLDGRFTIGPLAGVIDIEVSAPGFVTLERRLTLHAGRPRRESFVLQSANASLAGDVADAGGFPLRSAMLEVLDGDASAGRGQTDAHGHFEISGLGSGRYRLRVTHADYPPYVAEVTTDKNVELRIPYGGGLEGVATDAQTGAPLAGGQVVLTRDNDNASAVIAHDGSFRVVPLKSGSWNLEVRRAGYARKSESVSIPEADRPRQVTRADVRIEVGMGGVVSGIVRDKNGDRVQGASVKAGGVSGKSDQDGQYRLTDVPAGSVRVEADKEGARAHQSVTVTGGEERYDTDLRLE